ncbi:MAG: HAMP domain-containing histidine kinase [Myxococcales bacterium]|nr:HAMP domain-containing histidine kinase [Myxococcales bacterium]
MKPCHEPPLETALEPAIDLAQLLDPRGRRLLGDAASSLGLAVHIATPDGQVLIGEAIPATAGEQASCDPSPVDLPGGTRCRVQRLWLSGREVGLLALGPYRADLEPAISPIALHLERLVSDLLAAGEERATAARLHHALMEDANAELQHRNERLEHAVRRLEELDKIKSSFLATVSHELRTPLTSVIGYSEMLLEGLVGPLNPEQREYVTTVMEKGEQLLSIITGILDISRIEAGGISLDRCRFDVGEVIFSALSTVAPTARRKRLVVEAELGPLLPHVHGDRNKVRQVLINLVGNAVKFTPEGGRVVVRADVTSLRRPSDPAVDPGGERGLRIAVVDSGIGIPTAAMARIFDPFFQVDGSSTREFGGTGLGLSIVKSFITAHGGMVWASSSPGSGSTFFVTLPLAD